MQLVSISGTRARVEARYKLADAPAQPRTVLLELEDGEWRVATRLGAEQLRRLLGFASAASGRIC